MLTSVKAEIDAGGKVRLLEPLKVTRTVRAIVTVLDENGEHTASGNAKSVLDFLRSNRLPETARRTADEIDAQIAEARESWDVTKA